MPRNTAKHLIATMLPFGTFRLDVFSLIHLLESIEIPRKPRKVFATSKASSKASKNPPTAVKTTQIMIKSILNRI